MYAKTFVAGPFKVACIRMNTAGNRRHVKACYGERGRDATFTVKVGELASQSVCSGFDIAGRHVGGRNVRSALEQIRGKP